MWGRLQPAPGFSPGSRKGCSSARTQPASTAFELEKFSPRGMGGLKKPAPHLRDRLQLGHLGVPSVAADELGMAAILDDPGLIEHDNPIGNLPQRG